jgi:hypothetical protein
LQEVVTCALDAAGAWRALAPRRKGVVEIEKKLTVDEPSISVDQPFLIEVNQKSDPFICNPEVSQDLCLVNRQNCVDGL